MKEIQRDRGIIFIDRLYQKNTYKILSNITHRLNKNPRKIFKTWLVQKTIKVIREGKRLRIIKRVFFPFLWESKVGGTTLSNSKAYNVADKNIQNYTGMLIKYKCLEQKESKDSLQEGRQPPHEGAHPCTEHKGHLQGCQPSHNVMVQTNVLKHKRL